MSIKTGKMNIVILDPDIRPDGGWEINNRRHIFAMYAHSFMFDPFLIAPSETIPVLLKEEKICESGKIDLLICPYRQTDSHLTGDFHNIEKNGGGLIMVQPHADTFRCLDSLKGVLLKRELFSTKERWVFNLKGAKEHFYPAQHFGMRLKYQVIENQGDEIYALIGGFPEFFVMGKVGIFPTDVLLAHLLFLNGNTYDFTIDVSTQFVRGARRILGFGFTRETESAMYEQADLRRDFHSFGFAYGILLELSRVLGKEEMPDFTQADRLIIETAKAVVSGRYEDGRKGLKCAFMALSEISWQLAPIKKYILDSYHGGVLFNDVGYAEYDWPQHTADLFERWIEFVESKNYRFTLEVEAHTLGNFVERYPGIWNKINRLWKSGKVEVGNGSYSQPYPQYYPLESNIHQFENGLEVLQRISGEQPAVYVSQEFGLTPQMPHLLKKFGYKYVVHRVQNNGDVPVLKDDKILWRGKDRNTIETLPSHMPRSEKMAGMHYVNLALLIADSYRHGYKYAALTCLLDQTLYSYFREETIRTASYAPVLGEFKTFSEFFSLTGMPEIEKGFSMDDYQVTYFLPVDGAFAWHKAHTGNYLTNYMNAVKTENIILASESLGAAVEVMAGKGNAREYARHWQFLNQYENHDSMIVGGLCPGDFYNAFVQNYHGRRENTCISVRTKKDMDWAVEDAIKLQEEDLKNIGRHIRIQGGGFLVYNPLSCIREVLLNLPGNKKMIVTLPPLGYKVLSLKDMAKPRKRRKVNIRKNLLENEFIRLRIDEKTGILKSIVDKKKNDEFLRGLGNELVFGTESEMVCKKIEVAEDEPLLGKITSYGNIFAEKKKIAGFETSVSLQAGSRVIDFEVRLNPLVPIEGEQWMNSIRTAFSPNLKRQKVHRSYFNVYEETKKDRFFSLYFVRLRERRKIFDMYNSGNQYYLYRDGRIENILVYTNEIAREFRYAVGINVSNPLATSLSWQIASPLVKIKGDGNGKLPCELSFFAVDKSNVLISSLRHVSGKIVVRIMDTEGIDSEVNLSTCFCISKATLTDYLGNKIDDIEVEDKSIRINLEAWEVKQIVLEYEKGF